MRFFTGGINHETNTFSPLPATMQRFLDMDYARGTDLVARYRGTRTVVGGFINAAAARGIELVPTIHCFAMPSGAVERAAFERMMGDTLDDLRAALAAGPLDGVLLGLHGAMVIEGIDDGEAEYVRRVREIVGPGMPIVTELDLHANTSRELPELVDILAGYDTYPHVDVYERAVELTELLERLAHGEIRPAHAFRQIPVLANLPAQFSGRKPMADWLALCRAIEARPGVLTATIAAGFPYADIPDTGMSAYVATDGDQALADRCADELATFAWEHRAGFQATPVPVDEAVAHALASPGPVLLADVADNTGAGTSGDGTKVLRELIRQGARSAVVALMYDPETVRQAVAAGVGATIEATIGGKVDDRHGAPVRTSARVRAISDGSFVNGGPMSTGAPSSMGTAAVLEIGGRDGIEVICTTFRRAPNDANALRSVGIEPTRRRVLALKSSVHYRADFTPLVREIVEVDAPGLSSSNWSRFAFQRLRRPIYPLDPNMDWSPGR
ncbi:MAG TPA: M81 family metallopeptidase [Thermomicrobiaceae bacterium]|nr:M81 family metallopeptidase [Thermomicrobiaceae bacterium]